MKSALSRNPQGFSILVSIVIVALGAYFIQDKIEVGKQGDSDLILTPDEIRALPDDTIPVVLHRVDYSYSEDTLAFAMLKLIMDKSGAKYALGYSQNVADSSRGSRDIAGSIMPSKSNPDGVNIILGGMGETTPGVRATTVPVTGGLLGLRVACINSLTVDRFKNVASLEDLKYFIAVQGQGWTDAKVLRQGGIPTFEVETTLTYNLLNEGRVDYFPRSITSVESECHSRNNPYESVVVDPYIHIVHPAAWLYYVNADNQRLFDAVETGFDRALADGSYAQLLEQRFFTPWLKKTLDFPNRRIIYVSTPLGDALRQQVPGQYWLLPWERFERGEIKTGRDLCAYPVLEKLCEQP